MRGLDQGVAPVSVPTSLQDQDGITQTMSGKRAGIQALCLLTLLCLAGPRPALAAEPARACELPLVPVGGPGRVQLTAYVLLARLSCQGAQCVISVEQTYFLENKDATKGATLRLGLPSEAQGRLAQLSGLVLRDVQGTPLTPVGSEAPLNTVWEVTLERAARKDLVLAYSYPVPNAQVLRWCAETPLLAAWGTAESARIAFELPQLATQEALLQVEPQSLAFDGKTLVWNYENLSAWPRHELICLSPDAWGELLRLSTTGAHYELARLLMAIQEAAEREKVPHFDRFDEIVAELHAALQANPGDTAARLELAKVYRARAEARPESRLNYLLLATQELATVLEQHPEDSQVAEALSLAYYNAAMVASETGDPAGALAYLKKARSTGAQSGQDDKKIEELTLRWALNLAEQGRASQAMAELVGVLSPEIEGALLRYAPPLTSARTEVALEPGERVARSSLQLYPPTAPKSQERLQELSARLGAVGGCQATLEVKPDLVTLEVRLTFRSLAEFRARAAALIELLAPDPDLISALVSAPWQNDLQAYGVDRGYWYDKYLYHEGIDLRSLQEVWEAESQYVRWRLVELRNTSPADERGQWEQRFALVALREQLQIWESLPSGSYWIYRLRYPNTPEVSLDLSWLVGWGQARELELDHPVYHWAAILQAAALGGIALLVLLAVAFLRLRRR